MGFVATPNCAKVELIFDQNGVPVVNVFHVRYGAGAILPTLTSIAAAFVHFWEVDLAPNLSNSLAFQNVTCTDQSVINGQQVVNSTTTVPTGLITTAQEAANAAMVVSLRTHFTGRSFRGRSYVGGIPAASIQSSHLFQTAAATNMLAAYTNLMGYLTTISCALGVLSKYALGAQRLVGLLTDITSLIVDTTIDSQRRRTAN